MKVLVLAYTFYEYDNRVRRYAESLSKKGHQVDVIALRKINLPKFVRIKDVNVFKIQRRKVNEKKKFTFIFKMLWFFLKSSFFTTLLHIKNKYDLVHVHSPPDLEIFAAWFPRITGAKLILDIHDIVPEFYISKFGASKDSLLFKMLLYLEKFSIGFADHVIIANHIWYETLIGRSTTNDKCTVILNYPDPSIFSPQSSNRSNNSGFILSYAGSMQKHQGIDTAIRAISLLKNREPDLELHIYGAGREQDNLRVLAAELGVSNQIQFKGVVPLEKIPSVMRDVHLGVVPKRKDTFGNEAFSTKIFEFMAMRIPVIVADTKIDKYYFNDSVVCFFKSGDEDSLAEKILLLKEDNKLRNRLGQKGLLFANKNNWQVKEKDYMNIVNSLLDKSD
jgi:glycosyltransferase involved in cell wall biosynthesis